MESDILYWAGGGSCKAITKGDKISLLNGLNLIYHEAQLLPNGCLEWADGELWHPIPDDAEPHVPIWEIIKTAEITAQDVHMQNLEMVTRQIENSQDIRDATEPEWRLDESMSDFRTYVVARNEAMSIMATELSLIHI